MKTSIDVVSEAGEPLQAARDPGAQIHGLLHHQRAWRRQQTTGVLLRGEDGARCTWKT